MKKVGVAILGLGTVGGGTYEILKANKERILSVYGLDVDVKSVMDKSDERLAFLNIDASKKAKNIMEIAMDPEIDIVVETIGGTGIAKEFVVACLECGKTVVTANKALIAKNFKELHRLAKRYNAGLYYEASCVGGTPVIRTLTDSMQANDLKKVVGIVNGTTNYILSKMSDENLSYGDVLKEAQQLGFAELDPTDDVEGFDASNKISILSTLAFNGMVGIENVFREGITNIKTEDIAYGKQLGYTIKLLAIGKKNDNGTIEARVHPAFVSVDSSLASVKGAFNAVKIVGDAVGEIMLYGAGAGSLPTGSAIVSDILFAGNKLEDNNHFYVTETEAFKNTQFQFSNDFETSYYVRMIVDDKPGVLAEIGNILAKFDVSINELMQKAIDSEDAQIILTTHSTKESAMQGAIAELNNSECIKTVEAVIRIEK